jgi:P4 family phage/plasmid primase-like protien
MSSIPDRETAVNLPRPEAVRVNLEGIPQVLRELTRWVVWRYLWNANKKRKDGSSDTGDWDKPPTNARTLKPASSTNPATWSTFHEAWATYSRDGFDGIGLVLRREPDGAEGLVGIDLDHCRNPKTEDIEDWAAEIVREITSYTELSPSGCGLRIFALGRLPPSGRKKHNVEMYDDARYLTITGQRVAGTPPCLETRTKEILSVHRRYFGEPQGNGDVGAVPLADPELNRLDDDQLLQKAFTAKNGVKFRKLWDGSKLTYPSASEADLALCRRLAFWTGRDAARIDRLFRLSKRMRDKWDARRGDQTYGQVTIGKAIASCTTTYSPKRGAAGGGGDGGPPSAAASEGDDGIDRAVDDPHRLAECYLAPLRIGGRDTVRYWRDEHHRWDGRCWCSIATTELVATLTQHARDVLDTAGGEAMQRWDAGGRKGTRPVPRKVTRALIGDVLQALNGMCLLPSDVTPPAWIGDETPIPPCEVLAARNGLIRLTEEAAAGEGTILPPRPDWWSPLALDYDIDLSAPAPAKWLNFLGQLWPGDSQSIGLLQEWMGYCLTPDTTQQKILLLVGPPRAGKGTIARVLTDLIGAANVCAPTLSSLATTFGLAPLLGKALAIVPDARLSGRTDYATVVERLLSISGEDTLTIDRKFLQPVTTRLSTRLMMVTNELPRLQETSGALAGRFLVLQMTRSWLAKEDTSLTANLLKELPGILRWAIEGWRRLHERGRFELPGSSRQTIEHLTELTSPIHAFLQECCQVGEGATVSRRSLYTRWLAWCTERGEPQTSQPVFGRDLHAAVPTLADARPRMPDGQREWVYQGIGLLPDGIRHDGGGERNLSQEREVGAVDDSSKRQRPPGLGSRLLHRGDALC